jgi:hypothetical protein
MARYCSAFLLLVVLATGTSSADESSKPALPGFIKGYTWGWVGYRGQYEGPRAETSMKRLADTGAQWVCIAFGGTMKTFDSRK